MKKKNKNKNKRNSTVIKGDVFVITSHLPPKKSIKKIISEQPKATVKRYGRVIKEIGQVVRSSETGRFVSVSHYAPHKLEQFKGVRVERLENRAARSASTGKKGTRIGGPKRK
jgi:hypothetical protein